jgi:hypothetical protein
MNTVRVQFGVQEDARRVIADVLADGHHSKLLNDRQRARLAQVLTSALRDAGCLASAVEQHYDAQQTAVLIQRCSKYVGLQARAGAFGPVMRDDKGWLIPASGIQRWLEARLFAGSAAGVFSAKKEGEAA